MFTKVHRQSIGEQTARHATNWKPHPVEAKLSSPDRLVAFEDPVVEEVSKGPT